MCIRDRAYPSLAGPLHKTFQRNRSQIWLSTVIISHSARLCLSRLTDVYKRQISWYAVRHRTREIAIRKVHGASNWEIVWLLNRSFLWQILVAYIDVYKRQPLY